MDNESIKINYWAIVVATVVAFVVSAIWYIGFGNELAKLSDAYASTQTPEAWKMLAEFLRSLVIAYVLARFIKLLGITNRRDAVRLGASIWIFPAFILLGSIIHESYPWMLAAIHAGDWLVKLLIIAFILGLWGKKEIRQQQ